jgi:hypothetical protein
VRGLPGPWSRARFAHLAAAGVALVGLRTSWMLFIDIITPKKQIRLWDVTGISCYYVSRNLNKFYIVCGLLKVKNYEGSIV